VGKKEPLEMKEKRRWSCIDMQDRETESFLELLRDVTDQSWTIEWWFGGIETCELLDEAKAT
jgi:hypothetical protein